MRDKLNSDEYDDFEKLLDETGNNAWKKEIDFLGTRGGMIEHIWCEHGIDKRKFSVQERDGERAEQDSLRSILLHEIHLPPAY